MRIDRLPLLLTLLPLAACAATRLDPIPERTPRFQEPRQSGGEIGSYEAGIKRGSPSFGRLEIAGLVGEQTAQDDVPNAAEFSDNSSRSWRVRVEGDLGDNLLGIEFRGRAADIGSTQLTANTVDYDLLEITPHFGLTVGGGPRSHEPFGVAFRFGVPFQYLELEGGSSSLEYMSVGLRAEIEPELRLASTSDFNLAIYGRGSASAYATSAEINSGIDAGTAGSTELIGEAGVRVRAARFYAFAGYQYDLHSIGSTDEGAVLLNGVDFGFDGFVVGGGFLF